MTVTSPQYSFVKFGSAEVVNTCCEGEQDFCIPVIEEDDIAFQIKLSSTVYAEIQTLMVDDTTTFQLLLLNGAGNTPDTVAANTLRNWTASDTLLFERYRTGMFEVTLQWREAFNQLKTLVPCGGCFQLAFIKGATTVISNCFKRHCDSCYTSVLEYYNEDDYGGFNYCNIDNPLNRVRLPFHLTQPAMVEDKAVYRKSNGKIKQTRSLLTKQYIGLTDHFAEWVHERIALALAHDEVYVISDSYTGGISKSADYVIEWTDNICTAPANFKALATPFAMRNNNCAECKVIPVCDPAAMPVFTLPDAIIGVPYSHTETIGGSQPFTLAAGAIKPAWMTITIAADVTTFAGTPDAIADTQPVTFTVSNDCGSSDGSATINITAAPCIAVTFDGTPVLPGGNVGEGYSYIINLLGTEPFTVLVTSKPTWMAINVVGATIEITGTPDAESTDTPVTFTVGNCEGDSLDFSGTVTIGPAIVLTVNMTVHNSASGCTIGAIPPFYTIISGAFPLPWTATLTAHHTVVSGSISVTVGGSLAGNSLILYKNGTPVQTISSISAPGTYTFAAVVFTPSDDLRIELV